MTSRVVRIALLLAARIVELVADGHEFAQDDRDDGLVLAAARGVAVAAAMLLALVVLVVAPRRGPSARLVELAGDVRLNNRPARVGDLLHSGGELATGDGTAVVE